MNIFPVVILAVLISSCAGESETIPTRQREVIKVQLIDSLGSLSIEQPPETDTFFAWVRRNDCGKPCEEGRYRFQPKAFPVYKESGFFFINEPQDSVLQLTILHSRDVYLRTNDSEFAVKYREWFREVLSDQVRPVRIISDTSYLIGDRQFFLFRTFGYDTIDSTNIMRLDAFTSVKGNKIQFSYLVKMKNSTRMPANFLIDAEKNLRTVRFHEG